MGIAQFFEFNKKILKFCPHTLTQCAALKTAAYSKVIK